MNNFSYVKTQSVEETLQALQGQVIVECWRAAPTSSRW